MKKNLPSPSIRNSKVPALVDDGAVMIAEDLELDVPRVLQILLDVDVAESEGRLRLALCGAERVRQVRRVAHDAHPASAAAGHRLDDHRVADVLGDLDRLLLAVHRAVTARQHRDAGLLHRAAGARLVPHQLDDVGVGADEADVTRLAHFRQVGALGQEPISRVNRVGAGDFGGADDRRDVQVAVDAARRTDADVLVGEADVQRVLVGLGVDSHRLDAELATGDDDPKRDLAAVGDEDFFKHESVDPWTMIRRSMSSSMIAASIQ
jgi:hypothetical protein